MATRARRGGALASGAARSSPGADRRGGGVALFFGEVLVVEADKKNRAPDMEQRQGGQPYGGL